MCMVEQSIFSVDGMLTGLGKEICMHLFVTVTTNRSFIKYLHVLLTTDEENEFNDLMAKFISKWRIEEPDFIHYFEASYTKRSAKWALCYRHVDHQSTDTNMLVESFHNKLKSNQRYLDHKVNRRLDDLLHTQEN